MGGRAADQGGGHKVFGREKIQERFEQAQVFGTHPPGVPFRHAFRKRLVFRVDEFRWMAVKDQVPGCPPDPGDHFADCLQTQHSERCHIDREQKGRRRYFRDGTGARFAQVRFRWPIRLGRSPEVLEIVDTSESQVKAPGRDRRIVEIAFFFKDPQGGFTDPKIRGAENDGANTGSLLNGLSGTPYPGSLLLVPGGSKVFVLFKAAMSPSMRPQLMSALVTIPHQAGIRLGKTTCEKDGRRHSITVATIEESFEAFLRSRHPIAINGEVQLFRG